MDRVERPWGCFTVIDQGAGFQVKRLEVRPGKRLSLQSHRRRSEHWFVVAGIATVVVGNVERDLATGGTVDVPCGASHRLGNNGDVDVVVIEVQRGDYFGEDDIERHADDFGRV